MNDDFETLATYWSPQEAQISKNLLEAEGIPCFLQAEFTSTTLSYMANATGGARLQVRRSDVDRANAVLHSIRQSPEDLQSDSDRDSTNQQDEPRDFETSSQNSDVEIAPDGEDCDDSDPDQELDQAEGTSLFENLRSLRVLILMPFLFGVFYSAVLLAVFLFQLVASLFVPG